MRCTNMTKVDEIMEIVKGMTILELADVVKAFEEEFGVSAAPVAVAGAVAADAGAAAAEEKSSYNVVLTAAGDSKVNVIKVVKEVTGLGLKEAKEIVDNAPKAVKEGVNKAEADEIKEKIEAAGGSVELQ
jgi:large subunit ribosomal protein L7/L12